MLGLFNWQDVHSEVAAESRGRIALVGLAGVGKGSLYNRMMEWKALDLRRPPEADMGAFVIVDLPTGVEITPLEIGTVIGPLSEVDVILFMLHVQHGLRPDEYAWFSRLRGTGVPVLPLLASPGPVGANHTRVIDQRLGTPALALALDEPHLAERLSQRVLAICPDLAIPLGQHFRGVRREAARRVILQAAALNGIVGLEPVPMLDAPLQLAAQGGMVLRIGAIYGHPTGRGWPPELLGSTLAGVLLRLAAQQAVKWVPLAGWAVGGVIALVGTWLLGQAAVRYFEADRGLDWLTAARQRQARLRSRLPRWNRDNGRLPGRRPKARPALAKSTATLQRRPERTAPGTSDNATRNRLGTLLNRLRDGRRGREQDWLETGEPQLAVSDGPMEDLTVGSGSRDEPLDNMVAVNTENTGGALCAG